jgi:hypothetical protein
MALWSSPGVIARECLEVGGGGIVPETRLLGGDVEPETRIEERRFVGEFGEGIIDWPSAVIVVFKDTRNRRGWVWTSDSRQWLGSLEY